MLKKTFILLIILLDGLIINAQSVNEIKSDPDYLWGEGTGVTLNSANNKALQMLTSQISVQVESKFQHFVREEESAGSEKNYQFKESVRSVVNTYSNTKLYNTEQIIISREPDARIFRYIKRKNVAKVFESRKYKIFDFIDNAQKAIVDRRIGDGLRYYYWAFTLLKSHPDCNEIRYNTKDDKEHLLIIWIPMKMNEVFANINFHFAKQESQENTKEVFLSITYKGETVDNLDYSYWDGRDWSNLIHVKDGRGLLQYYGAAAEGKEKGNVKVEYIYENQANIDKELKSAIENIDSVRFRQSFYTVPFNIKQTGPRTKDKKIKTSTTKLKTSFNYRNHLIKIEKAINQESYETVKNLFTRRGYEMFEKLIAYGNAKILSETKYTYYKFRDGVMARALPMVFSFKSNNKRFVEDVVFHFNKEKKIESLSFALSKDALKSIIEKDVWGKIDRMVLINFLEHYKTAYALERLHYIESIFADDALIITGYMVKVRSDAESRFKGNRIVRLNRRTKQEYIKNLKRCFQAKEYINIQFEESRIRKGGTGGSIYGIQIKQNYYSSNYGDQGYLFLMVDLNDPEEPIIHIRTWQPTKNENESIYGLSDF